MEKVPKADLGRLQTDVMRRNNSFYVPCEGPQRAKLGNRPTDIEIAAGCDPPAFCVRCIIIGMYVRYRANRSHSCLGNLCGYC
jgi:hypothetical protein